MKKINLRGGFTLIELLTVVALIGIVASVVLASLNAARGKSADVSVKSNLHTVTTQAEIFFIDNSNSYLPAGGSIFGIAPCPAYNASGTNMLSKSNLLAEALAEAINRSNGLHSCYNSSVAWAVAVGLRATPNTSWCVDNTGTAKMVNSDPSSAINGFSFACN